MVTDLERVDADVRSLRTEMSSGLAAMDARFEAGEAEVRDLRAEMNSRFEQVDRRFEQVDQRFEQVDARFEQVDRRFDEVDRSFVEVRRHFVLVEASLNRLVDRFDAVQHLFIRASAAGIVALLVVLLTTRLT